MNYEFKIGAKYCLLLSILVGVLAGCASVDTSKYSTSSSGAVKSYKQGREAIKNRKFDEGVAYYQEALDKDPNFAEAHKRLGSAYKTLGKLDKAKKHFYAFEDLKPSSPDDAGVYFVIAGLHFSDGDYKAAKKNYEKALDYGIGSRQQMEAQSKLDVCNFAIEAMKDPVTFAPEKLKAPLNQFQFQDYPVLTADHQSMFFTVREGSGAGNDEDIVKTTRQPDGSWSKPQGLSINTSQNEGAGTISADGKTMVFASCNWETTHGKSCDLYITHKVGGEWQEPENMGDTINTRSWESNPSLSADGRTLYFASSRGGGEGSKDIWVTHKNDQGVWQKPKNLGSTVNTKMDEAAPFIHANGRTLFFVSTGYPGMGGYDIYYSNWQEDSTWTEPENVGYPINSQRDDGGLFITADGQTGYFSIYEQTGFRSSFSRLYRFEVPDQIAVKPVCTYAKGTVTDAETGEKLSADIELYNVGNHTLDQKVTSDAQNGNYLLVLARGAEYALHVHKEGYLFKSKHFDYKDTAAFDPVVLDIALQPVKSGQSVTLTNVFFETNKYELKEKSRTELLKVMDFLKTYPDVKVEISGHTDNVGSKSDNMTLSRKRARSVYEFLVQQGISKSQLTYKGYGESKPVASNDTPEGRRQNRRIEFKILKGL